MAQSCGILSVLLKNVKGMKKILLNSGKNDMIKKIR